MPVSLITADSYDAIRGVLDTSLDVNGLPNELIDMQVFGPEAEAEVVMRDPLALSYAAGTVQRGRVENAAIYLTAARLAPALPQITAETLGDWRYNRAAGDINKQVAFLRGMAAAALAANLSGTGRPTPLPGAWLAYGRRGR